MAVIGLTEQERVVARHPGSLSLDFNLVMRLYRPKTEILEGEW